MKNEYKSVVTLPKWVEALTSEGNTIAGEASSFSKVPLIYRAVNIRSNALSEIPVEFKDGEADSEWLFPEVNLKNLIWKTEASLLLSGAAYWLRINTGNRLTGVQWLNPFTMSLWPTGDGYVFMQSAYGLFNGKYQNFTTTYTKDQIAYFCEFNPTDDFNPGISSAGVALGNARLMHYLTRYASAYFEGGAMPTVILGNMGNADKEEKERTENFFRKMTMGLKRAWGVLAMSGDVKPNVLSIPLDQMVMPELAQQARQAVALAFGIPQTMLDDAANYATAVEHRKSFYDETIKPRTNMYEDVINTQFFKGVGVEIKFKPESMDIYQEDESKRAASLVQLKNAGLPLITAMEVLGYDLTEEQWAAVKESENKPDPIPPAPIVAPVQPEEKPVIEQEPVKTELKLWQRKSINAVKRGKPATVDFITEIIPPFTVENIQSALMDVDTIEGVKAVFAVALDEKPDMATELKRANDLLEKTTIAAGME